MKSSTLASCLLAGLIMGAQPAIGATQGQASTTASVGTFTIMIGNIEPPRIRVFGLQDMYLASRDDGRAVSGSVSDRFCVAHSGGGSVLLTFSGAAFSGASGTALVAREMGGNGTLNFQQSIYPANRAPLAGDILSASNTSMTIPSAQSSLDDCSSPNVAKGLAVSGTGIQERSGGTRAREKSLFVSSLSITATPK